MRRPRKKCNNTGGIGISDDDFTDDFSVDIPNGPKEYESLYDRYLIDDYGKVVGEAKQYDPYSKFGHIMLYEIDSFGYVPRFIKKGLRLMSEEDMMSDENLKKSLEIAKYETWKIYNIIDLIAEYDRMFKDKNHFDRFCKMIYKEVLNKQKIAKNDWHL